MSSRSKNQGLATMTACITQDQRLNIESETKTKRQSEQNPTELNTTKQRERNRIKQNKTN